MNFTMFIEMIKKKDGAINMSIQLFVKMNNELQGSKNHNLHRWRVRVERGELLMASPCQTSMGKKENISEGTYETRKMKGNIV